MRTEKIGKYINRATGKVYEVVKRTQLLKTSPLSDRGVTLDGSVDYITSCGINLNPKSDDDSVFEMLEINGNIHRQ